jgi:hypothetical protein
VVFGPDFLVFTAFDVMPVNYTIFKLSCALISGLIEQIVEWRVVSSHFTLLGFAPRLTCLLHFEIISCVAVFAAEFLLS